MRRFAILSAFLLAAASLAVAAPPTVRDVRAPGHLKTDPPAMVAPDKPDVDGCCGGDEKEDPPKRMLGRAFPKKQFDVGEFHIVVGQDGKARYFPRLSRVMDTAKRASPLPASIDWSEKAPTVLKRMYQNDRYGCCVISSRYHQIGFQTAADTGKGIEGTDAEVVSSYQLACGRGDNGCDMSAVNQYQQKTGLKLGGVIHKSDGSVAIDHTNVDLVKSGIVVFGGVNVGLALPQTWYSSADGSDWGPTSSAIVGGHEVQAYGYDDKGVWISTWGGKRRILWTAFTSPQWIDETYVTLSADWYGSDKLAPNGIDAQGLKDAMALIAAGKVPPLPDPVPPTPPTPPVPVPPVPVPPVPVPPLGDGFTGTITTTKTYKDGKLVGESTAVGDGPAASGVLAAELKAAGVPLNVILDVLKLVADIKAKAGRDVIFADVLAIISDLGKP